MRAHDDERTTESRQPTLRALPMVELREARGSDVRAGGSVAPRRRVEPRPSTVPLPKPGARWEASPRPAATREPARAILPTPPRARPGAPARVASTTQPAKGLHVATPPSTPRPGFAMPGRLAIADVTTELHEPPPLEPPLLSAHEPAVRAWVDPASIAPPPWAHAIPPHAAPTSTAVAHAAAHELGPTVPIVEVHAPLLRFGPIEKGILILAGFSVVAVVISTIFHAL